ncbi:MAG: hypothetical protein EXR71_08410 [Myxococcales bacterium]|nr:hypothetical protein [Myxococcales bacterium]
MLALFLACVTDGATDAAAEPVPWTHQRPPLDELSPDGFDTRRAIIHLHSPLSHDACDDHEMEDAPCLADLRAGLCDDAIDFAFFTDHPAAAASTAFADLFNPQEGDEAVDGVASRLHCDGGHEVLWLAGIEDELMPVGLDRHVSDDPEENDRLYNGSDAETFAAEIAAGGVVLQAHTEGQTTEALLTRQQLGLHGVEFFNLHAMVDPNKREDDLGLEALDYLTAAGPFISGGTSAEPDLVFLAFYQEQTVSLNRWDALGAVGPTLGTAGTDAHQNALPMLMSDGERVDSYRRMMSWFSNYLLVDDNSPAAAEAALRASRSYVVFDALGTPNGFAVRYGDRYWSSPDAELGQTFAVSCPSLAANSPTDTHVPTITATVYKDGLPWQAGCGEWTVTEAGVYRVRIDIVPEHLRRDLAEVAADFVHSYPWLYSQAFRIGL